jgi:hypothetical protein
VCSDVGCVYVGWKATFGHPDPSRTTTDASSHPPTTLLTKKQLPQGSGPLGLPAPGDVQRLVAALQDATATAWPQLQQMLQQPGAQEFAREVSGNLSRRFVARVIKFGFGLPEVGKVGAVAQQATR